MRREIMFHCNKNCGCIFTVLPLHLVYCLIKPTTLALRLLTFSKTPLIAALSPKNMQLFTNLSEECELTTLSF